METILSRNAGQSFSSAPVGLVLSGGGAKGAYQAGVWKAMAEAGLDRRVAAVSGTSVGAINAAAIAAVRDPETIRRFWHERVASVVTPDFAGFSPLNLLNGFDSWADGKPFPFRGLLDRSHLAGILDEVLPAEWPADAPAVHATALALKEAAGMEYARSSYRLVRFRLEEEPDAARRRDKILASAAIPWCYSPVEIDGRRHVDGGWDDMGGDNVPVTPILENHPEIRTIIVIRCNSRDLEPEPVRLPPRAGVDVLEIRPSRPLPGIFDPGNLGGGILTGALVPGLGGGMLQSVLSALARLFDTPRAKVWGGSLAFSPSFTDRFFETGYKDGLRAFRYLLPA